jgi:methyl-accepting chemotaxis protein
MSLASRTNSVCLAMASKVNLPLAAVLVFGVIGLGAALVQQAASIRESRLAGLQSASRFAAGVMAHYAAEESAGRMSRGQAQTSAFAVIGAAAAGGPYMLWISDGSGRVLSRSGGAAMTGSLPEEIKTPGGEKPFGPLAKAIEAGRDGIVTVPGDGGVSPSIECLVNFPAWSLIAGAELPLAVLEAEQVRAGLRLALALGIAGGALGIVIGLIERSRRRRLRALAAAMAHLAEGALDVAIPASRVADELAELRDAAAAILRLWRQNAKDAQAALDERAEKDRRQAAMDGFARDFGDVIAAVLGRLTESAQKMSETAREMTKGNERTQSRIVSTAERVLGSSDNLTSAASAALTLAGSVDGVVADVARAQEATRLSVDRTSATSETCGQLAKAARRIGDIGTKIAAIAHQTNLLALNATIEANRAGEAGKGFAVVAMEVKGLAGQTARATTDISDDVRAIREAASETAAAIDEVAAAIVRVDEASAAIVLAVERQSASTREIATVIQGVADSSGQAAFAMEELAALADETAMMGDRLTAASDAISHVAETLKCEVVEFLQAMSDTDSFRRRFERYFVDDMAATIGVPGRPDAAARIENISRGGALLRSVCEGEVGDEVILKIGGGPQEIHARIVRRDGERVALTFRQSEASLALIDQVTQGIAARAGKRAA